MKLNLDGDPLAFQKSAAYTYALIVSNGLRLEYVNKFTEVLVKATIGIVTSGRWALLHAISLKRSENFVPTDLSPLK